MKKIVRNIWIGALSGLAVLTACNNPKSISRQERKQLMKERDSLQEMLREHSFSCVYGSPDIIASHQAEAYRLQNRLDSINAKLGEDVDLEKSARRADLQQQIADLKATLFQLEYSKVYGSPEIIKKHKQRVDSLRQDVKKLEKELQQLESPSKE